MDALLNVLNALNGLTPLAVIGLLAYIIFLLVRNAKGQKAIAENHLHGLPEMAASLERIEAQLRGLGEHIIYIRARINGK